MTECCEGVAVTIIPDNDEKPPEEQERKPVKIRFSVFFDGTLNNRLNIDARELAKGGKASAQYSESDKKAMVEAYKKHSEEGSSFENGLTNIAKMEPFVGDAPGCDHTFFTYIEGPGTKNLGGDKTRGYAFGTGDTGVTMKVLKGILQVKTQIEKKLEKERDDICIAKLTLDVFGFSRGAAAARYFIYQVMNTKSHGRMPAWPLRRRLISSGFDVEENAVEVNFVGLYDTVASFGLNHSNDTRDLKLDSIGRFKAQSVVHLVAADEHRANFSSTNIDSAKNGKEIFLPGVHSDVGGSYYNPNPGQPNPESLSLNSSSSEAMIQQDRQYLINSGWYKEHEIWIEEEPDMRAIGMAGGLGGMYIPPSMPTPMIYTLRVTRAHIESEYSNIPLHIMAGFARDAKITLKNSLERNNSVRLLKKEKSKLMSYAKKGGSKVEDWLNSSEQWVKKLRNHHLHFSAHLTTAAAGLVKPNKPNLIDGQRTRKVNKG